MEINIYWNDLTEYAQNNLFREGFIPKQDHYNDLLPVGKLEINNKQQ